MSDNDTAKPFRPHLWQTVGDFEFTDITYHRAVDAPVVRIAFDRPEVRNAFRPHTVDELYTALEHARTSSDVGAVLLTGNGPSPKDGGWSFCSGGDQRIRGRAGYQYAGAGSGPSTGSGRGEASGSGPSTGSGGVEASGSGPSTGSGRGEASGSGPSTGSGRGEASGSGPSTGSGRGEATSSGPSTSSGPGGDAARLGRLHILEVQRLIRFMPKVVIALVGGWAAGGGHSLHVVCDLTLASAEQARFKQTDADVGSFDGGFGSAYLARQVGQKRAREIFFLGQTYDADEGHRMGMVNKTVPHAELEDAGLEWAKMICAKSPTAQRMLKFAFNAIDDGMVGQQVFAGETTRLAYMTDEAAEGRDAFLERRAPDWSQFPYYY